MARVKVLGAKEKEKERASVEKELHSKVLQESLSQIKAKAKLKAEKTAAKVI